MIHFISRFIGLIFLKLRFGYRSYGAENIPKKGAVIVASNHASDLDPFAAGCGAARYFNYMAKEELFEKGAMRWWMRHVGAFPVKRQKGDRSALEEAIRRLKQGKIVLLFPEGGRTPDGKLQEFQAGVGFLSTLTGAPIVPAYIKGTFDALPKGADRLRPARISVYYGRPIAARKDFDKAQRRMAYEEIAQEVRQAVVALKNKADENKTVNA